MCRTSRHVLLHTNALTGPLCCGQPVPAVLIGCSRTCLRCTRLLLTDALQDNEGNSLLHELARSVAAVPVECVVTFNALALLNDLVNLRINPQ